LSGAPLQEKQVQLEGEKMTKNSKELDTWQRLAKLDERWIYLGFLIMLAIPIVNPMVIPIPISDPPRDLYNFIEDNIETITDGTDKLMAMNPVTHTWKANPDAPAVHGFIAQEMQDVIPEAVSGEDGDDEMMSMDYGRITPVIVAALQDALKEIEVEHGKLPVRLFVGTEPFCDVMERGNEVGWCGQPHLFEARRDVGLFALGERVANERFDLRERGFAASFHSGYDSASPFFLPHVSGYLRLLAKCRTVGPPGRRVAGVAHG